MSKESPARYIDEIVEPTVKEFENNPTSVRHAFLACVAVFHTVDYLAYPKKSRTLREQFDLASPDFAKVDNVAHAFKHVSVGPRDTPDLKVGEVISRPPANWDEAEWDLSEWDDVTGGVTLDKDRGTDLLKVLERAVQFLRSKI